MKFATCLYIFIVSCTAIFAQSKVLSSASFKHYIDSFNANDDELYKQFVPNNQAWTFLENNIPFFECPDKQLEETYYFRWWTYRKHIKQTPSGFVISEFLPDVSWAGKYNTISCAASHHFYEGRWLHNSLFLNDYMHFWLNDAGDNLRRYSFWSADAWLAFTSVHNSVTTSQDILSKLEKNYEAWKETHGEQVHNLYWQVDGADGMEVSVGGQIDNNGLPAHGYKGIRPTINSYMYGDARALGTLTLNAGNKQLSKQYLSEAADIKHKVQQNLWSDSLHFFGTIPLDKDTDDAKPMPVRELIGFVPWYFNLPDDNNIYGNAWLQLKDTSGFNAPYGPTTCERRHKYFSVAYTDHECQWNGPSWPYATAQTLTAMANVLNNYKNSPVTKKDYFELMGIYSNSQRRTLDNGKTIPWIDENLNPFTGDWISRTRLANWNGSPWPKDKGGKERGKDYNHSTFCDLVISGLIGIRPSTDNKLIVHPLISEDQWDYFCLDNVLYHGKIITIFFDKTGKKYSRGKGFNILINGKQVHHSTSLQKAEIMLN
ncbi:hypothetical protein QTN47_07505 [Danxiaibacter flavus]|uniref:Glycoside hydrolase n=1 Tax=Danxiaibacter flavus TaxID=3049108 RepID=A0ABV3ZCM0_9BACT|nr:hypothetical protein QNM32_07505 [Chitinophagaceae bacterium DXS]